MGSTFILLFFFIIIGIPVLAGTGGKLLRQWMKLKERQMELVGARTAESAAQYASKTDRLEQRVAVLERLLTDRSTHLADEIESLRDKPLN